MITIIRPPMISTMDHINFSKGIPPLGLAYIAGSLEDNNIEYDVIDGVGEAIRDTYYVSDLNSILRGLNFKEIIDRINPNSKYIGFSSMFTAEWHAHKTLLKKIKAKFPDIIIILGGEHASSSWESILNLCPEVDVCIIGEGEETFVELYNNLQKNESIENIDGIAIKVNGVARLNKRRNRVKNIDNFNISWDKFPVNNYLDLKSGMHTMHLRAMPILASRGCPYRCTFCSSPFMWGTEYYTRSPKSIVAEMKSLMEKYHIEHFDFTDLSATINKKWTIELCEELIKEDLGISFQFGPGTRSEVLTPEVIKLLKEANIFKLCYAPESGSEKTIKKIKKKVNLKKMYKSMKESARLGIQVKCHFIMGMPEQSKMEMLESAIFAIRLAIIGVDDISIYAFYPYPGSEISNKFQKDSKEFSDEEYSQMVNTRLVNGSIDKEVSPHSSLTLFLFTSGVMFLTLLIGYLLNPSRIFSSIKNLITNTPKRSIEMYLSIRLRDSNHKVMKKTQLSSL